MRKRKIAALLATVALSWPAGGSRLFAPSLTAKSSSIKVELAQEGSAGGGYTYEAPVEGSGGGRVMVRMGVCSGKSAGEPCSFAGPDGESVSGTCTTMGSQLACVSAEATGDYGTGQPEPQPEGAR